MLPWFERSSDLSPIEHVLDTIGRQLLHCPQTALTIPVLTQQVQQAWDFIPESDIWHLFDAMHARLHSKSGIVVSNADFCAVGLVSNPGEGMDVCNFIVPLWHAGTLNSRRAASPLVKLVEGEERCEAPDPHHPENSPSKLEWN
ncbi:uncharacterized protein TNCV_1552761 [Trichonephila clavipes]|nr:uncharacterized protein TNCV_1552761 [Trichonephila clavipes]